MAVSGDKLIVGTAGRKVLVCIFTDVQQAYSIPQRYISVFEKFNILLPSIKLTYFCVISFISPAR